MLDRDVYKRQVFDWGQMYGVATVDGVDAKAVSYTHLDVYKRQRDNRRRLNTGYVR